MLKRIVAMIVMLSLMSGVNCYAKEVEDSLGITSKSAILMDVSTGKVIYEKNADEILSPASITKIMTLLIIFEELENNKLKLDDEVVTSEYAMSMGGSQVFLQEGEVQSVNDMIKCIVVASGNDASVAMAEHIEGSEKAFVERMNKKADELGMKNTNFEDCCGLTDSDNHYTTANDVAVMSRELLHNYPEVKNYSTIWMDTITHVTNKGSSEFGLSNTNKLLKMACGFEVTGLKTGSTSKAKYCLSASGKKDNIELVAVVMAAPDFKVRFSEAKTMLEYGFSKCSLYTDDKKEEIKIPVKGGKKRNITVTNKGKFSYLFTNKEDVSKVEKKSVYAKKLNAPVKKSEIVGMTTYYYEGKAIGNTDIVAVEDIDKARFTFYLKAALKEILL